MFLGGRAGDGGQAADPEFAGRAGQGGPLASVLGLLGGKASAEAPPQPLPDAAPQAWVHSVSLLLFLLPRLLALTKSPANLAN